MSTLLRSHAEPRASAHETSAEHDPSIARVLLRLYAAISFEEGSEPDWQSLTETFSEHARITRVTPEGIDYMDRRAFLAMTRDMFDAGAYTSFYEVEMARRIECFGNVAQVWSVYETRRNKQAQCALNRGINSIQLVRVEAGGSARQQSVEGAAWQVMGLLWDEVYAHEQLDLRAHFAGEMQHAQS